MENKKKKRLNNNNRKKICNYYSDETIELQKWIKISWLTSVVNVTTESGKKKFLQEIYCNSHVPVAGPHDIPSTRNGILNGRNSSNGFRRDAGLDDMKIAHAIKATQVSKPYPKIKHGGARYIVVSYFSIVFSLFSFFKIFKNSLFCSNSSNLSFSKIL